jgi:SAM-dependent methyltransferase
LLKIVRFNWPWYAASVLGIALGTFLLLRSAPRGGAVTAAVLLTLLPAAFWLVASLAVSHFVYDRSAIARGTWIETVDPRAVRRAGVFHAGLNEAAPAVERWLPAAEVRAFDFHGRAGVVTPSLERARRGADGSAAAPCPGGFPLPDGALDLGLVVFAAHEVRDDDARGALFAELKRVLAPAGRILVVEHLRDAWNFLAYGPGAFHFLSRATWRRAFAAGGLALLRESRCTPFVSVFELGRQA